MKETNNENEEKLLNNSSEKENKEPKGKNEKDKNLVKEQKQDKEKKIKQEEEKEQKQEPEYILSKEKERKSIIICLVISIIIIIIGAILSFRARYINKSISKNKSNKDEQLSNVILLKYNTNIAKEYKLFDSTINNILDSIDSIKIDGKKEKVLDKYNFTKIGEHTLEIKLNKNITSLKMLFKDCDSLTNVDFSYFNSENINYLEEIFSGCSSLVSVNFTNFSSSKVDSMRNMFSGCTNLQSANFEMFDTSKVKDMSNMFMNCKSLEELDLSSFDTSNVIDMSKMFFKCTNLKNLHINNFKTEKVTNMERMFEYCMNLEYLDIHNFDTLSVTNMDYMFHGCSNLKSLDLSKFNTSAVKSMMSMFASCISLNTLNLSFFDFSDTINSSYMLFDTGLMILDLSKFKGESIIFNDDILKFNPNLKYIDLQKYNGKDIFKNLKDDSEVTICADNDTTKYESNLLSLKEKNAINNCSDYCFSEFRIIKDDKTGCEINCSKIENETNIYYYLCNKDKESSIISNSDNFEDNVEKTITTDTILPHSTIIDKIIPKTSNIKTTILHNATNNEPSISPQASNIEPSILTNTISTTHTTNSMTSKYIILLYGYDNYISRNNFFTFSIYFLKFQNFVFPKYIFFTINIIFEYIVRNLAEQSNQNITCSLENEKKELANYNCTYNPVEKMDIMKITVNYDFNFNYPIELLTTPIADYNKDKIVNQTGKFISNK